MMEKETLKGEHEGHDDREKHHGHSHGHGRSFRKVREIIEESGFSEAAKETALDIYSHIAEAEAKVHDATLETVHFHEVGRDEAVKNALAIGMALEIIAPDKVVVSDIYDGHGTILCSHGEISVPRRIFIYPHQLHCFRVKPEAVIREIHQTYRGIVDFFPVIHFELLDGSSYEAYGVLTHLFLVLHRFLKVSVQSFF